LALSCQFHTNRGRWPGAQRLPTNPSGRGLTEKHHDLCRWICCGGPPTANREIYKNHAEAAAVVFKEHGALKLVECWGDDVPDGEVTSFPMAVKRKDDETVVFSWIIWPSRQVRDQGMKNVMADPRLQPDTNPMPFDGKRLIYGGFEMLVEA